MHGYWRTPCQCLLSGGSDITSARRIRVLPKVATLGYSGLVADDSVAQLLRRLRAEQGRSLRGAARDLGVDPSYLSRVENGERQPSGELEERISSHYGLERDSLDLAAGRVPADVLEILRRHPDALDELRRRYGG